MKLELHHQFYGLYPTIQQLLPNIQRNGARCNKRIVQIRNTDQNKFVFKHSLNTK
jgi:hypothetical protein